jgi:DNA repair exonuclease SbcCD ATPase subunit
MCLNYIFHLSDLHIRNGDKLYCRYDEYKLVFSNTILSIKEKIIEYKLEFNDYIIIITGDVFHNKSNIGNYGLLLYKTFIQDLLNIGRVYILHGNHDLNQSEINQPSLVYSSSFNVNNLVILNESQSFIIDNIGFSYVSIEKTLDNYKNSGRIQDLPPFPKIKGEMKYSIALFHGSFASARLYNGDDVKIEYKPYPLEWIQEFDYVLLGDIHKRQTFTYKNKTKCGYSGSLIQQNFGEDIIDHGYLIWNLQTKNVEEINVTNDLGYINIKQNEDEKIVIRKNGKYDCLLETEIMNNLKYFPKSLEIKTFSKINFETLNSLLKKYNIRFTVISNVNEKCLNIDNGNDLYDKDDVDNIVNNNYILSYFSKLLSTDKYNKLVEIIKNKELLLFDVNNYTDDLTQECIKKNKELLLIITSCIKSDDIKQMKQTFTIRYLEWDGLLCYENKNWINMQDLNAKTFMVKGKNGTGKSAIYHILLLAIWGKIGKECILASSIINSNKKNGYTIIDIEIDGILYRIQREFIKDEKKSTLGKSHIYLYKFTDDITLELQLKDSACNSKIDSLFGNIDSFLSSSMITQNIDNDILNLKKDDILKIIDKSCNIEYIYNLYNLFKTAVVKYKDFRKIVESKKQVYERLISNCKIEIINDEEIKTLNEELSFKLNEKEKLNQLFDDIKIDVKNPENLIILETDYISLIKYLDKTKVINDTDIIEELKKKYNELKIILKDEADLLVLSNAFNSNIKNYFENNDQIIKPCELSVLENERKQFENYLTRYTTTSNEIDLKELEKSLKLLKDHHLILKQKEKLLIETKPIKVDKCDINKENILKEINEIYGGFELFKKFILTLNISKSNACINVSTNYNDYIILLEDKTKLEEIIQLHKTNLSSLEINFNLLFKKQQDIYVKNKPLISLNSKLKTSAAFNKEIKLIKIEDILKQIENDEKIISFHSNLYIQLSNYNNELALLTTKDEYQYDPKCKYCCKRPWVCRINEILSNINKINGEVININDLNCLIETNEKNKIIKNNYDILNEWYNYYKSKEQYDKITKDLNKIIKDKGNLANLIEINNEKLILINKAIYDFNNYSLELYDSLLKVEYYENYKQWENSYNDITQNLDNLNIKILNLDENINYYKNIKPRIDKYFELSNLYDKWLEYDCNIKIKNANEFLKIKEILNITDKYNEYNAKNTIKPFIKEKMDLNTKIQNKETEIKILNDRLVKLTTINSYNNNNKENYNKLFNIIIDLDTTIEILETIIINFQAFRIEMYDKFILNKLIEKSNKIIKSLCHKDTKPFKLDYIINVSRDIININWLINNEDNKTTKQIISIHQASGFQHFVISMALRMSLFMNKYEVQCNQLFIDEGFVNFDKYNLSIVPIFLKSLLSYFNSVIIVSHIDLIQDNVDEIIEIDYNKSTTVSKMEYKNYKNVIVKCIRK